MIVLGIDSSSVSGSCAVLEDGVVLAQGLIHNGLTHSQTLLPLLADTLRQADRSVSLVDLIAVVNGPGSFTGLRIGLATAKGIAAVRHTPCIGISSLEAAAYGVRDFKGLLCPVMDARCGQVYNALFTSDGQVITRLCPDRALPLTQLQQELAAQSLPVLLVGDGTQLCYQRFQTVLPAVQAAAENRRYISGAAVAQLGILYAKRACNPAALQPVYLRLPQAQRELLKKQVDSK